MWRRGGPPVRTPPPPPNVRLAGKILDDSCVGLLAVLFLHCCPAPGGLWGCLGEIRAVRVGYGYGPEYQTRGGGAACPGVVSRHRGNAHGGSGGRPGREGGGGADTR